MAKIENVEVFGLETSIYRSGYPMLSEAPNEKKFRDDVEKIKKNILEGKTDKHIERAIKLATQSGGGHDQFLTGIIVNFDMTFSNKAWVEAERYTFLNFISSMSTMHRITKLDVNNSCNMYVAPCEVELIHDLIEQYEKIDKNDIQLKKEAYLMILYNLPSGFEITAGMTTNYRSLKNIYAQRRNHRLPDWKVFCDWCETLPMNLLITGYMR